MEITKVLNLTAEEMQKLTEAGTIIKGVATALESNEADVLAEQVRNILGALETVIGRARK